MAFLRPNYEKPGPGIDKDAPQKKGLALFFDILVREFWQLVKLNLIFIIACIPIVTIGAALAGLSKSTTKMVRDVPNDVWDDFKTGFKENWKPATVCGAFGLVFVIGSICGFYLYSSHTVLQTLGLVAFVLIGSIWIYIFPMLTSTTLSFFQTIQNSILLSIVMFFYSLPASILCLAYLTTQFLLFPLTVPFTFFLGFSIPSFIASFAAWAGIRRYVIKEESPEAE